jgi:hypothetical protein
MLIDTACKALREGKVLELRYEAYSRALEVHACGYTKQGHAVLRGWQVGGGSKSGEKKGWKLLRLDEASAGVITEEPSQAPRRGYKLGDKDMARIICEISSLA